MSHQEPSDAPAAAAGESQTQGMVLNNCHITTLYYVAGSGEASIRPAARQNEHDIIPESGSSSPVLVPGALPPPTRRAEDQHRFWEHVSPTMPTPRRPELTYLDGYTSQNRFPTRMIHISARHGRTRVRRRRDNLTPHILPRDEEEELRRETRQMLRERALAERWDFDALPSHRDVPAQVDVQHVERNGDESDTSSEIERRPSLPRTWMNGHLTDAERQASTQTQNQTAGSRTAERAIPIVRVRSLSAASGSLHRYPSVADAQDEHNSRVGGSSSSETTLVDAVNRATLVNGDRVGGAWYRAENSET